MSAAAAPAPLNIARARRLTKQLREALTLALDLLLEVFEGRAWEALGYPTWEAYCAAELPELAQLRMPLEQRQAAVAELRGRGMSSRAIGAPLGLSHQTVQRDLKAAGVQLATVTSLDGRMRPAAATQPAPSRPRTRRTDRVVELLAAAGPAGLSVLEVAERFRWRQHIAAATLCRLAAAGRIAYVPPARRGLFGTYVAVAG
jgi:transposase